MRGGGHANESSIDCHNNDCSQRPKRETWYMITYTLVKESVTDSETGEVSDIYKSYTYLDGQLSEEKTLLQKKRVVIITRNINRLFIISKSNFNSVNLQL